ncbi:MAG: enoyl-CoA hydratase-related protein, partial [Marinobacterium sp.]|nr:enoyl-CoA hydratase-related protein [Marinobacterium sp.]
MSYEMITVEIEAGVGTVTLNRPAAMNALNVQLTAELGEAIESLDANADVRCIVLTGGDKVFAAGADIKEMKEKTFIDMYSSDFPYIKRDCWRAIDDARTPVVAAVAGFALGGGCEMAMACDFIIAAESAKFGQPEIGIGTMPGAGGTQRL